MIQLRRLYVGHRMLAMEKGEPGGAVEILPLTRGCQAVSWNIIHAIITQSEKLSCSTLLTEGLCGWCLV